MIDSLLEFRKQNKHAYENQKLFNFTYVQKMLQIFLICNTFICLELENGTLKGLG